ncbi:phenylacetate--CoA ligase family protein [Methanosarcina sp. KYL-1]|nr:phenylacetate--CoA ligase family protein [Methanosarcina sp. KYL-1]
MISRVLFILAHQYNNGSFYSTYKKLKENQYKQYDYLRGEQDKKLQNLIKFSYENVPYYHNLLNGLKLKPDDIKKVEDLEKLPILDKETIIKNWEDFKPKSLNEMRYQKNTTGGSTGKPLNYRLLKKDKFLSQCLLCRGWGYGGYELGDKVIFLAGSSLDVGNKKNISSLLLEKADNFKKLSSFDMDNNSMEKYVNIINKSNYKFLRGYASSIDFLSSYIENNGLSVSSPRAIFTTAEKLYPHMRKRIENAFDCNVFDTYGLNDGGISAYECSEHSGLHIDTERSIMEVVDDTNSPIEKGVGRILATSLENYAMPFIRYDTEDLGNIIDDVCGCGRKYKLLKEITGRQQEMLQTPERKYIHGEFFTHIIWEITGVKEFQVVQEKLDRINIKLVADKNFDKNQLDYIKEVIGRRSETWNVEFEFVENIDRTKAGKYKFVINKLK